MSKLIEASFENEEMVFFTDSVEFVLYDQKDKNLTIHFKSGNSMHFSRRLNLRKPS